MTDARVEIANVDIPVLWQYRVYLIVSQQPNAKWKDAHYDNNDNQAFTIKYW